MPSLDTIVNVNVTANTKTVSRAGFGIPLVLSYHTRWLDRYRLYTKSGYPSNMTDDGFTTSDLAYQMVGKIFSQNPSPSVVAVGRRTNAFTQTIKFIPTPVAEGYVHKLTITGNDGSTATFSVTEGAGSSVGALCTSFESVINAGSLDVTATDGATEVTVAADVDGTLYSFTNVSNSISIQDVTADAGVAADLAAVLAEYDDAYGVCLDSGCPAENKALAAAVQSLKMVFVAQEFSYDNGDSGSTTDTAYVISNSGYSRSGVVWCGNALDFAGAAVLGMWLPNDPGGITLAHKTLAGVSAGIPSATFETNLLAKRGNSYTTTAGVNILFEGTTGTTFFDIIRITDTAEARVKESVFGGMVNAKKIPFTDKGGSTLKGLVLAPLNLMVKPDDSGAFASDPAPYCIVPKKADILAADINARNFAGIEWGATLAGAVHKVQIKGTLSTV